VAAAGTPRGVLWDVGNVIVRWDPRTLYVKIFPDPDECDRFLAQVCTPAWNLEHDRGRPMDEGIAELSARFPAHAGAIGAWKSRFFEMVSGVIPETVAAMEALHARGAPMFGLTNMSRDTSARTFALHPAFGLLQDIVVSGEEGLVKPDPRIYAIACRRSGLAPGELLFVDDSQANIEAADALGFHTHLFADPADLGPALCARGLL
jgi:FMN phosphatase YigB (HAD superfamily)